MKKAIVKYVEDFTNEQDAWVIEIDDEVANAFLVDADSPNVNSNIISILHMYQELGFKVRFFN